VSSFPRAAGRRPLLARVRAGSCVWQGIQVRGAAIWHRTNPFDGYGFAFRVIWLPGIGCRRDGGDCGTSFPAAVAGHRPPHQWRGTASESREASWWACHQSSAGRGAIAPVKPPGQSEVPPRGQRVSANIPVTAGTRHLLRHRHPGIECGGDGGPAGPLPLTAVAGHRPPHLMAGDFGVIGGSRWCCVPTVACRPVRALSGCCPSAWCGVACGDSGTTAFEGRLRSIRRWLGEGQQWR
jgi:hypothetical protein